MLVASRHDRDPYSWDHNEDCTGESLIEGELLTDAEELREAGVLDCPGCAYEFTLLEEFVAHEIEMGFFDRVMSAFSLAGSLERFGLDISGVDAFSLHDMLVVTAEQARFEVQQMINDRNKS